MHRPIFRSLLMPGPQTDPSDRHGTNPRTCDSVDAYWVMPLPPAQTALSPARGKILIPSCPYKNDPSQGHEVLLSRRQLYENQNRIDELS